MKCAAKIANEIGNEGVEEILAVTAPKEVRGVRRSKRKKKRSKKEADEEVSEDDSECEVQSKKRKLNKRFSNCTFSNCTFTFK